MNPSGTFDMSGSSFGFGTNFSTDDIQTDSTINFVMIVDNSISMKRFATTLNDAVVSMISGFQGSHIADRLFYKTIHFGTGVRHITGFQPIALIDPAKHIVPANEGSTALYDGAYEGIKAAYDYRLDLENSGVSCKTIVAILTDGDDNASGRNAAQKVKQLLEDVGKVEKNIDNFQVMFFGIGDESTFKHAAAEMGIPANMVGLVGASHDEIRKMIGFISASASRSQSVGSITF